MIRLRNIADGSAVALATVLWVAPIAVGTGASGGLATARAINLRASDLPGLHPQPGTTTAGSPFGPEVNATCSGLVGSGRPRHAAHASSPLFVSSTGLPTDGIQSSVEIEQSRRVVTRDLAVARSRHTRVCLKRILQTITFSERGEVLRVTRVRVTPMRVAIQGTTGSFGLRITGAASVRSLRITFNVDMIDLAVGRDEIALSTRGTDEIFPRGTERQLSRLLVSRALALPH